MKNKEDKKILDLFVEALVYGEVTMPNGSKRKVSADVEAARNKLFADMTKDLLKESEELRSKK